MTGLDAPAVSTSLAARIDELVRVLLPQGQAAGGSWRVGNLSGAKGGSLAITLAGDHRGRWRDFATGERGDALDLVKAVRRYGTPAAIEWSRRWLSRYDGRALAPASHTGGGDDEAFRIKMARAIWDDALSPRHTIVRSYLGSRELKLMDSLVNKVIRYHPRCPWRDANDKIIRVPAMVAAMRSIATDEIKAVHRTRLSPEGRKILEPRMLGIARGAAIKLDADERVRKCLIIGEGVETAMTAQQLGLTPAWALGSASAIEKFPVVDQIEYLMILAENNEANARAREICATRWYEAGREVIINWPTSGDDLNDSLQGMERARRSLPRRAS